MARWNKERRLLDHEHSSHWKYRLQEVDEPNLMRDIFPYTEVARIDFDYKFVLPAPPEQMLLTDTTFRDGQQARPPYTVQQIVDIFDMLHRLCAGLTASSARASFSSIATKTRKRSNRCRERDYTFPEITGWIRAHAKDLGLVKEMGLKETGILTSVSDYHIFLKLNWNRRKAMDEYLGIVKAALEMGIMPRCHYGGRHPGGYLRLLRALCHRTDEAARRERHRRSRCGCATPWATACPIPGAALPRSVPKLVRAMIDDAGVPGDWLEWHGHNDFHKVHGEQRHRLALRLRGGERRPAGLRRAHRQRPHRGHAHGVHLASRASTDGIDTRVITEIAEYFEQGTALSASRPAIRLWARTSTSPAPASTPTGC